MLKVKACNAKDPDDEGDDDIKCGGHEIRSAWTQKDETADLINNDTLQMLPIEPENLANKDDQSSVCHFVICYLVFLLYKSLSG